MKISEAFIISLITLSFSFAIHTLDLSKGCPYSLLYNIPPSTFRYSAYQWKPNQLNYYVTNEVITYYTSYKNGLLPVLVCYRPAWKHINNNRTNIPPDIVAAVQFTCVQPPCDAGHIIPSVLGGRDIITNIRTQDSGFNRGAWSSYEKSIKNFLVTIGDEIFVVVKFEYDYNDDHEMTFIDSGTRLEPPVINLFLKQPTKYFSFTFSTVGNNFNIRSCGHYKNDRSANPGTFINFNRLVGPNKNLTPLEKSYCGVL